MKILLAVVMSLTVVSSVWAVCDKDHLSKAECPDKKTCEDALQTWKDAVDGKPAEGCIAKIVASANQKPSVCDMVNGNHVNEHGILVDADGKPVPVAAAPK
jgi:hypothetical protein